MSGADAGGYCRGGRLISSNGVGKNAAAVLAALAVANVEVGSCEAGAGVSCRGRRLLSSDVGGKCAVVVLAALAVADVDIESCGADADFCCGGKLISSVGGRLMSFHLTCRSCHGGRLISSDGDCKCAAAVLAALAVADVDVGSQGADAGGSCHGRRLISSDGGGKFGLL